MKKYCIPLLVILIGFFSFPSTAHLQVTGSLWKLSANSLLPVNTSWSVTIPQLGGGGTQCVQVTNTGLLQVSGSGACGSGSGSSFPFTPQSWGNSTTSVLGFPGFISTASSTISYLGSGIVYANNGRLSATASSTLFGVTTPGFVWGYANGAWGPIATSTGGGGSVTAVTGTYPILSSGGNTPVISTAFGTTTTWGMGNNGLVMTGSTGIPFSQATSSAIALNISGNAATVTTNANLSGAVTSSGSNVTSFGSISAGVLGTSVTGIPSSQATSTLYGTGTGGQVLGWNNNTGGLAFVATSSSAGGSVGNWFTPSAYTGAASPVNATTSALRINNTSGFGLIASSTYFTMASTSNFEMRMYAGDFAGSDIGAKINNAYAALPANGGIVYVPCATLSFSTAINVSTNNKPVAIIGCGADSTTLTWTGQATSTIINTGQSGDMDGGLRDLTLTGTSTTDIAPGIEYGGSNGYAYGLNQNLHLTKFGKAITLDSNSYIDTWDHVLIDFNVRAFGLEYSTNSGENISFTNGSVIADGRFAGGGSTYQKCVDLEPNVNQGLPSINFNNTSFDKCQVYVGPEVNAFFSEDHFEELSNSSGGYAHLIIAGDSNTSASVVNSHFLNGNDATHSPQAFASTTGGNAYFTNVTVSQYSGVTPRFFNANTSTGSVTYNNVMNVGGTGYTTLESGSNTTNLHSLLSDGSLELGTTTVASTNTQLYVVGPAENNADAYQFTVADTGGGGIPRGISMGYDNSVTNSAIIHPVQAGVTALDLFIGSPFALTKGLMLKQATGNFGIGTTSPFAQLSIQSNTAGTNLFAVSSSTAAGPAALPVFQIGPKGDIITRGQKPLLGVCGTASISATSSDYRGTITVTAGTPTSCTITYSSAKLDTPTCFASGPTSALGAVDCGGTASTTGALFNLPAAFSGSFTYLLVQ